MSQQQFFSDDINELQDSNVYNVICQNHENGRYCYGFLNEKTGTLSTGFQFEEGEDLDIVLDTDVWVFFNKKEYLNNKEENIFNNNIYTVNVLILKDDIPYECFSFLSKHVEKAEKMFISKIKENIGNHFTDDELDCFLEDGHCLAGNFIEVYLIHSS